MMSKRDGRRGGRRRQQDRPQRSRHPKEATGSEAAYLRSLVDSRRTVVVTLTTGESFRGRVRYYDRDCFSLGLADRQMKIFLRKASVLSIQEE
jgi:small nuclear ribonucleoprotein (snRNP)-like protein